jgi:hypothetical protein
MLGQYLPGVFSSGAAAPLVAELLIQHLQVPQHVENQQHQQPPIAAVATTRLV